MKKEKKAFFVPDAQIFILLWSSALVCLGTLHLPCKLQLSASTSIILSHKPAKTMHFAIGTFFKTIHTTEN